MKPGFQIEKMRDEEFEEKLDKFFDDEARYTKHLLETLMTKYRKVIMLNMRGMSDDVKYFFDVIEELQHKHEDVVKDMKRRSRRAAKNNIGEYFKDGFLRKGSGLIGTYNKYFDAMNTLMPPLKRRITSSRDFFHALLELNEKQRDEETVLSLMYTPMTRLLAIVHKLEEFIFLLTGMSPMEVSKLTQTKNALMACFLKGPRVPSPIRTPPLKTSPSASNVPLTHAQSKNLLGKRPSQPTENKSSPKKKVTPPKPRVILQAKKPVAKPEAHFSRR